MPFVKRLISEDSKDFTLDDYPKRCSYKKIDKNVRLSLFRSRKRLFSWPLKKGSLYQNSQKDIE